MSRLYVAPDAYDDPTIWRARPDHPLGDRAALSRTTFNAVEFDALADLIAQREKVTQLADDLCDFHIGHGDYLSAGKRLRAILAGSDIPCGRCAFVPTPGGRCICREVS